ncbi:MAG: hypothetical protein Q8R15_04305 [Candidatus Micrarchaeota archaeon]|nr:hypothetical protein [Candidatus Micrarchaeota archaeon]
MFTFSVNAQSCNDYCANGVYANANYNPETNDCEYVTTQCENGCNFFGNACATNNYNYPPSMNENPVQNNYNENASKAQQIIEQFELTQQPNFQSFFNVTASNLTPTLEELTTEAEQAALQAGAFETKIIFSEGSEEKELKINTKDEIELVSSSKIEVKINGRTIKTQTKWVELIKGQLKPGDVLENILVYKEEEEPIVSVQKTTGVKLLGFIPVQMSVTNKVNLLEPEKQSEEKPWWAVLTTPQNLGIEEFALPVGNGSVKGQLPCPEIEIIGVAMPTLELKQESGLSVASQEADCKLYAHVEEVEKYLIELNQKLKQCEETKKTNWNNVQKMYSNLDKGISQLPLYEAEPLPFIQMCSEDLDLLQSGEPSTSPSENNEVYADWLEKIANDVQSYCEEVQALGESIIDECKTINKLIECEDTTFQTKSKYHKKLASSLKSAQNDLNTLGKKEGYIKKAMQSFATYFPKGKEANKNKCKPENYAVPNQNQEENQETNSVDHEVEIEEIEQPTLP